MNKNNEAGYGVVRDDVDVTTLLSRRNLLKITGVSATVALANLLIGCTSDPTAITTPSVLPANEHPVEPSLPESSPLQSSVPLPLTEVVVSPEKSGTDYVTRAAESLLNMHEEHMGGWRFKSEIQAPHYQTDRDVGAASVGIGFLALAQQYPDDPRWVSAANHTADWLTAVSIRDDKGGRYWPDYVDEEASTSFFTSFDDGALGIGDYYWRLYEHTKDLEHKKIALETVQWTMSQAEENGGSNPEYSWKWDVSDPDSPQYMGMGEGLSGIVHTLATYYERTISTDPPFAVNCKKFITGALRNLDIVRDRLETKGGDSRAIPENGNLGQDADTAMNAGYLSGAAGTAFMYMKLSQVFDDADFRDKADELFDWLEDTDKGPMVRIDEAAVAFKIQIDPNGGDDDRYATGFEEGNAGIGWSYLQAYNLTHDNRYLSIAKQSANWLIKVGTKDKNGGMYWREDEHPRSQSAIHANLNNGAAGIGMFMYDLHLATGDDIYLQTAQSAQAWLINSAVQTSGNMTWNDIDSQPYSADPSWHWGSAGIIAFLLRTAHGVTDIPGQQSGITSN